jgi:hypothetical protein
MRIFAVTWVLLIAGYAGLLHAGRNVPASSWCAWEHLTESTGNVPIYATEDLIAYHIWFARRTDPDSLVNKLSGVDATEDRAYFLPRGFDRVKTVRYDSMNEPRLWLAFRAASVSEHEPPIRHFLVRGYLITERRSVKAGGETAALYLLER